MARLYDLARQVVADQPDIGRRLLAKELTRLSGDYISERQARNLLDRIRSVPQSDPQPIEAPPNQEPLTGRERDEALATLMENIIAMQDTLGDLNDRQPVVTVPIDDDRPIMVVHLSDTHIGGAGVDHRQMIADMQLVRDTDGLYAVHLGDWVDNFSPRVIPAGMLEQLANPHLQWELAEMFVRRHLGDKLLVAVEGNHDSFSGAVGLNPCRSMLRRLGVPSLGPGGRVWLQLGEQTYKCEYRHDFPFKSSLNTTNSQRRLAEFVHGADVVGLGHLHYPDLHHAWRGDQSQIWFRSSSYKVRDSYADSKGLVLAYAPSPIDMVGIIFWPDEHKVLPFRNFRDGLLTLQALRQGLEVAA